MSDTTQEPAVRPYRRNHGRQRAHRPISVTNLPSEAELASQPHKGEAADRFSLYTPDQIEAETRTARLIVTFDDVIKIRDQADMIIACMRQIIVKTREHDIGSVRQRIEARREAASLGAALAIFNGKTPYGYAKKKPRGE